MASENPQIPKQHKAAVYDRPGTISTKVVLVDTPEPGPGEVLINLTHSGVCHSDYSIMKREWMVLPKPTPEGQVGGHEGIGIVVKLGEGSESTGIKVGDRVGIKWIAAVCGRCEACLQQSDGCCINQKVSGYINPGTFQQYVLGPANYVTPIPDGLDSATAAPFLCAGVTVYSALLRSEAKPGNWVMISGAGGGLGNLACQIGAKALGFRIIGLDHPSKADPVLGSGAEHFVDITQFHNDDDIVAHVQSLTGGLGVHAVIVCVASNRAYAQAIRFLRFNGTLVCVGLPAGELIPVAGAAPQWLVMKQLRVIGSLVGNQREAIGVLDFAARGIVKGKVEVRKLEDLTQVFEDMGAGKLHGRVVLDLTA